MSLEHHDLSDRELLLLACQKLETLEEGFGEAIASHGKRIKDLEKWRWVQTGGLGVLAALFGWKH